MGPGPAVRGGGRGGGDQTNNNFVGLLLLHNTSVYPKDVTVFGSGLSHLLTYEFYLPHSPPRVV